MTGRDWVETSIHLTYLFNSSPSSQLIRNKCSDFSQKCIKFFSIWESRETEHSLNVFIYLLFEYPVWAQFAKTLFRSLQIFQALRSENVHCIHVCCTHSADTIFLSCSNLSLVFDFCQEGYKKSMLDIRPSYNQTILHSAI